MDTSELDDLCAQTLRLTDSIHSMVVNHPEPIIGLLEVAAAFASQRPGKLDELVAHALEHGEFAHTLTDPTAYIRWVVTGKDTSATASD